MFCHALCWLMLLGPLLQLQHWMRCWDGRSTCVCLSVPAWSLSCWLAFCQTCPLPAWPVSAVGCLTAGAWIPQWRTRPCPRDRARMLSAFMVMFGFLIALPNRRRKKRAEPRSGCVLLIPCLWPRTCLPLPAPSACPGPCRALGTVPRWGPCCSARKGQGLQGLEVVAL